jgi:hypothetical protein
MGTFILGLLILAVFFTFGAIVILICSRNMGKCFYCPKIIWWGKIDASSTGPNPLNVSVCPSCAAKHKVDYNQFIVKK